MENTIYYIQGAHTIYIIQKENKLSQSEMRLQKASPH